MIRSALILFILSLCAANCGAQTNIVGLARDSCQCVADSQSMDSSKEKARLEKFFYLRTAQRLHQLDKYISLISNDTDTIKIAYYKRQIIKLFNSGAKVTMKRKRKVESIGIRNFIDNVASHKTILKSLDSINVPKWDYELVKMNTSDSVFSQSEMRPFKQQLKFGNDENQLAIIKEDTEDGAEWIPQFGDLVVTLKKDKNKIRK